MAAMPIISTRADIEKTEQTLRAMTDLEVDQAYQAANRMVEEELITLCLLELHRRHLVGEIDPGPGSQD